ncbi:hypothetical protein ACFL0U_03185 [Pseudomonadota bacterium]
MVVGKLKKKKEELVAKARETSILSSLPDYDFIPYACYYDQTTILTKNFGLLQTIKIPGFYNKNSHEDLFDIREYIRESIEKNIENSVISFWFHTIRQKRDLTLSDEFDNVFSRHLENKWADKNGLREVYVNDLYITIVFPFKNETMKTKSADFLKNISFAGTKRLYLNRFKKTKQQLNSITSNIISDLEKYGAYLLSIKEGSDGNLYSEHSNFLSTIFNLENKNIKLNINDISEDLAVKKFAFGKHDIEVMDPKTGNKRFATVISIKNYVEVSPRIIDKVIQLPYEIIVTEVADFVNSSIIINTFEKQNSTLDLSKDDDFYVASGLDDMLNYKTKSKVGHCVQQLTIMLCADSIREIKSGIIELKKKLDDTGLIGVREDIFMPKCFWSQIPANYGFLSRFHFVTANHIGSFCSIHYFPVGKPNGNLWGEALSVFNSIIKTPYFFSIHNGKVGHTAILGPRHSGKSILMNFILAQANRQKHKLYYITTIKDSEVFIRAINGNYYKIRKGTKGHIMSLNPLLLPINEQNLEFLNNWIQTLVSYNNSGFVPIEKTRKILRDEFDHIPSILKTALESKSSEGFTIDDLMRLFNKDETVTIHNKLKIWSKEGKYSIIFNSQKEMNFDSSSKIGFDLTSVIKNKVILIPILYYILYKIEQESKGEPTIIAIDNAWSLFDNSIIGPEIIKMLERMTEKNIHILFSVDMDEKFKKNYIKQKINNALGTVILLPNKRVNDYYADVFNISDDEKNMLGIMSKRDRNFIIKSGEDVVISSLDLSGFEQEFFVLSGGKIAYEAMNKAITTVKNVDSKDWIELFYENAIEMKKQERANKLKEREAMQKRWEARRSTGNTGKRIVKK